MCKEEDRFPHASCLQDQANLTKQVLVTTMECLERLIDRVDTLENDMKAIKAMIANIATVAERRGI